eukprot:CAMPEP_0113300674 /NCGR_PEP_ID=MMETSP0010_2-20120614/2204_1 /TAXON_ID=216773 ORGANISM="Corethron hystrix, Strain 308" /NCGR_SAMPLE_ID=MMETSP0010_2 /ASSEMBLY_ACC=CAM_ASM_000155 /LENGTH=522 /DNA_ID=CAMNT_0000154135 /DNA_START=116 /DNA_END=1680 /DNA_ORIENTATION=- /assembly_acc=CAM_ASM_000155
MVLFFPFLEGYVVGPLLTYMATLYARLLGFSVVLLAAVVTAYRTGLFRRFVHRMAEQELRRKMNGARVTIGSLAFDLPTGHLTIRDLIVHTPERARWAWDSPLVLRAGYVHVHCSWLSLTPFPYVRMLGYPVRDVYTLEVEDGQVFVEKRGNVFNFHLLDDSLELPDPALFVQGVAEEGEEEERKKEGGSDSLAAVGDAEPPRPDGPPQARSRKRAASADDAKPPPSPSDPAPTPVSAVRPALSREESPSVLAAEKKANEIVSSMLGALSGLTKSLNEGGKEGLERAFRNQRDGFVSQLRKFQDVNGKRGAINLEDLAADGMKVMKHVGRAVEKNVAEIQQQVDALTRPPPKKRGWIAKELPDRFRIGRIVVRDVRIFVKGLIFNRGRDASPAVGGGAPEAPAADRAEEEAPRERAAGSAQDWNRPIHFREITMTAAELCPSASASSATGRPGPPAEHAERGPTRRADGGAVGGKCPAQPAVPPLGLSEKDLKDRLLKRVLMELAKTNSGRVLQTAYGEALA